MKYGNKKYSLTAALFGKHIFAAVLCLILSVMCLVAFGNRFGRAITQFCDCAVYFSLIYTTANSYGEKDKNLYLSGQGEKQLFKGLKSGLAAGAFFIAYSFALLIFKAFGTEPGAFLVIYRFIINPFYMPANLTLLQTSLSITEMPLLNILISGSLSLAMPVVSMLGYIIGFGQTTVKELLVFKEK